MKNQLVRLCREETGQDLSEYAMLMAVAIMLLTLSIKAIGQAMSNLFSNSALNVASS